MPPNTAAAAAFSVSCTSRVRRQRANSEKDSKTSVSAPGCPGSRPGHALVSGRAPEPKLSFAALGFYRREQILETRTRNMRSESSMPISWRPLHRSSEQKMGTRLDRSPRPNCRRTRRSQSCSSEATRKIVFSKDAGSVQKGRLEKQDKLGALGFVNIQHIMIETAQRAQNTSPN